MDNWEMSSMIRGYVAANLFVSNFNRNLAKEAVRGQEQLAELEEYRRKCPLEQDIQPKIAGYLLANNIDDAEKYLADTWTQELIYRATHQKPFPMSLETLFEISKRKYLAFFEHIGRKAPEELEQMTAERMCQMLGVKVFPPLTEKQYKDYIENLNADEREVGYALLGIILAIALVVAAVILG